MSGGVVLTTGSLHGSLEWKSVLIDKLNSHQTPFRAVTYNAKVLKGACES